MSRQLIGKSVAVMLAMALCVTLRNNTPLRCLKTRCPDRSNV